MLQCAKKENLSYYLPDKTATTKISRFFSLFADETRIRILSALAMNPLCVNDLSELLDMGQTAISHQLRILKDNNIVCFARQGKQLVYSISHSRINEVLLIGVESVGY